jgi:hypothetical protein
MDVRVMGERGAPGMKYSGEADPGAEMLGVGGDGESVSAAALNRMA